eukprot:scaffold417855_cov48-Prasinocladus_malaysianus.AAC.1
MQGSKINTGCTLTCFFASGNVHTWNCDIMYQTGFETAASLGKYGYAYVKSVRQLAWEHLFLACAVTIGHRLLSQLCTDSLQCTMYELLVAFSPTMNCMSWHDV